MRFFKINSMAILATTKFNWSSSHTRSLIKYSWVTGYPAAFLVGHSLIGFGVIANSEQLASLSPLECPFKVLTGVSCPTCGLTRGLAAGITGEYQKAWNYHFLSLVLIALGWVVWLGLVFKKEALLKQHWQRLSNQTSAKRLGYLALALYVIWGFALRVSPT